MKMRGRAGPAGIPGSGTALIPADKDDPEGTVVAVVASGTGEYITTTMAATFAAERLYQGMKKIDGGKLLPCEDSEVLEAFIKKEFDGMCYPWIDLIFKATNILFLGHPSVLNRGDMKTRPVIGLLAVKATRTSIKTFYAHNSTSFVSQAIFCSLLLPNVHPGLVSRNTSCSVEEMVLFSFNLCSEVKLMHIHSTVYRQHGAN